MPFLASTADLIEDALRKSGEKTDGTSDYADSALKYMNGIYQSILGGGNEFNVDLGEPWTWAKAQYPGVLTVSPCFATGTVSVTQGSASGVFSSAPATSVANQYLRLSTNVSSPGTYEWYRIATHNAGQTAFTLDGPFNDPSQSGATFQVIQLDFTLTAANIMRQIGPMKVYRAQTSDADYEGKIVGLDMRSFEKKWPLFRLASGIPTEFGQLFNPAGAAGANPNNPVVRFNKFVDSSVTYSVRIEYDFIPYPADLANTASSYPIIPLEHRQVLSTATAFEILTDKEDAKAQTFYKRTQDKLNALIRANRREFMQISKNRGRMIARGDDFGVRNWPTSGQ